MGVSNVLSTGKSGLFASRAGLATTGHNIANVNTEGFSRQRIEIGTTTPNYFGNLAIGTGTRVDTVRRINDEYLDKQITNEVKYFGQFHEKEQVLAQVEDIFNEINDEGMNRIISKMFNEFRKLGNEPESESLRATVRESATALIGNFRRLSRSIRDVQRNIDNRIQGTVREVNRLVKEISNLNHEIQRAEAKADSVPDLEDKRDLAVKQLSELIDTTAYKDNKGNYTVSLQGVGPLVSGVLTTELDFEPGKFDPESGVPDRSSRVLMPSLVDPDVSHRIDKGRLGGLLTARNEVIGRASRKIDELAFGIATRVNALHRRGYNLSGNTNINFFEEPKEVFRAAEMLEVSNKIRQNSANIATALQANAPGDNRLAQLMGKLQHERVMADNAATFDEYYNSVVAEIATATQQNKANLQHQTHVMKQLDKLRESVSGVSLDEETTNLVQYQHAFDASAKVIQVADEMMETVLNLKR